ncbi:unnamed protein product [Chondrus crispus]|uniref:Uncharacterized protein n=1 Tax=Chondrus crispus TaxID=2769 RepID=R7Q8L3_CHOCR|nr:unnamed protein product [Chondrus crispus]CDF33820.1 unnamed protein product [Chondrus crispus]|eukprot:XP_005713639.1 unnamed protein product [Chondrus crispus]
MDCFKTARKPGCGVSIGCEGVVRRVRFDGCSFKLDHCIAHVLNTAKCMSARIRASKSIAYKLYRGHCSFAAAKTQIQQRLNYAIWSKVTVATSILTRMPAHATDVVHPLHV